MSVNFRPPQKASREQVFSIQEFPCMQKRNWLYNLHEETHGRRYSTTVQRLRAGLHLHRCGSGVLSGTWLFDPKALQELPHGKEERSGGVRLPFGSGTGYSCHLLGLRPAYNSAFRAAWRSSGLLPGLLPGAQGQRRWRRQFARTRSVKVSGRIRRQLGPPNPLSSI